VSHHLRLLDGRDHTITDAEFNRLRQNDRDGGGRPYPGRLAVCKACQSVVRFIETEAGRQTPVAPFPLQGNWHRPIHGYGPERTDGKPPEAYGTLYVFPQNDALARGAGWTKGAKLFPNPPATVWGYRPHHADCPDYAHPGAARPPVQH
jgi:hypothetical protein